MTTIGMALIVSGADVYFRDVPYLYDLATFLLWVTSPVFYPKTIRPGSRHPFFSCSTRSFDHRIGANARPDQRLARPADARIDAARGRGHPFRRRRCVPRNAAPFHGAAMIALRGVRLERLTREEHAYDLKLAGVRFAHGPLSPAAHETRARGYRPGDCARRKGRHHRRERRRKIDAAQNHLRRAYADDGLG